MFMKIQKLLSCPITKDIFIEPVVASDGFSYEKYAIQNVLKSRTPKSPITREPLSSTLYFNKSIKSMIDEFRKASKEFQDEYNTSYDNYKTQTTFMFTNETPQKQQYKNIVIQAPNKQLLKNMDISKTGM